MSAATAYWNVRLLAQLFKFDEIRVHSRARKARRFRGAAQKDLGRPVRCGRFPRSASRARHLVEASRLTKPERCSRPRGSRRARGRALRTMSAIELDLADIMDKCVDDWVSQGRTVRALRRHIDEGKLGSHNLHAELGQIVAGSSPGAEARRRDHPVLASRLSLSDIALAMRCSRRRSASLGQSLRYSLKAPVFASGLGKLSIVSCPGRMRGAAWQDLPARRRSPPSR